MFAVPPAQREPPPETAAEGRRLTVTVALPETVPEHPAFETAVSE
jgi:hypothetical protein